MTSSSTVAKKQPQQVTRHEPQETLEAKETSATASASGRLNLNLFGALSGAFSSKSSKTTEDDGTEIENREHQAQAKGIGAGNGQAKAAVNGQARKAELKQVEDAKE